MSFLNTIGHILNPFENTGEKIGAIALNHEIERKGGNNLIEPIKDPTKPKLIEMAQEKNRN